MNNKIIRTAAAVAVAASLGIASSAMAGDVMLPKKVSWTAYGTTASGYAQSVAIGNAIKKAYGTTQRIIPGKNDVSRMAPLRDKRADFCACGIASYFGQEGVLLFASKEWGPQDFQVVMTAIGTHNLALSTAKDANIKTMADLKGKRVSWVRAGDALNWNVAASLAFAGLTWDDVTKVEVSGFKASVDAIINGQSDAAFMSTITPHAKRLAASPRGLYWPQLPHSDKEGWARMNNAHPVNQMHVATSGAHISKDAPHQGATYAYPALITNADKDVGLVYSMVKGTVDQFDKYKNAAPGAAGWSIKNQNMTWALPYHKGAIMYWKEVGIWSDDAQAHNDKLVKRQNMLMAAWKALPGKDSMSKEDLKMKWMAARAMTLKKAGLPLVFN
ncbi:MAG: TAXI family TRAP transporter solute-binding subunit [Alphaproteobacteria bacterium]|nr:TAXI family TRAP transporter solute-binding subunit [Alphaproteobacteria bacterium]